MADKRDELRGIAVWYDRPMRPERRNRHGEWELVDVPVLYAAGCFRDTLRDVRRGKDSCELLFDHEEGRILCTTENGLELIDTPNALHFRVTGETRAGRMAIEAVRSRGDKREASVTACPGDRHAKRINGEWASRITTALLVEISIVPRGACDGTRVIFGRTSGGLQMASQRTSRATSSQSRRSTPYRVTGSGTYLSNTELVLVALFRGERPGTATREALAELDRRGLISCSAAGVKLTRSGRDKGLILSRKLGRHGTGGNEIGTAYDPRLAGGGMVNLVG